MSLRRLAQAIAGKTNRTPNVPGVEQPTRHALGVIAAIHSTTVDVYIGGSTQVTPGLAYYTSYVPVVGHTVRIIFVGNVPEVASGISQ